jgi:hypothetical protein
MASTSSQSKKGSEVLQNVADALKNLRTQLEDSDEVFSTSNSSKLKM